MPGRLSPVQDVCWPLISSLMLYMHVPSSISAHWRPGLLGRKSPCQRKSNVPSTQGTKGSGLLGPCLGVSLGRKQSLGLLLSVLAPDTDRWSEWRWGPSPPGLAHHTDGEPVFEIEQIFFFYLPTEKLRDLKRHSQFTRDQ